MNEEFVYILKCSMCEVNTEISVFGHDVKPVHCPMCGHDIDEDDLIEVEEEEY